MQEVRFKYAMWKLVVGLILALLIMGSSLYWILAFTTDLIETPATTRKVVLLPITLVGGLYLFYDATRRLLASKSALIITSMGFSGHILGNRNDVPWNRVESVSLSPYKTPKFYDVRSLYRTIEVMLKDGSTIKIGYQHFGPRRYMDVYKSMRRTFRKSPAAVAPPLKPQ